MRASDPHERTPFVARDAEIAELKGHLDRMLLGQGALVLLGGEAGVGKTRLVRELQRIARARGYVAITGQCYEQEGAPPFGPFIETMEQAVRLVPQGVRAALGDVAAEMTMMAPELRRVFADIPPLPDIPPEQKRRVLFNAYLTYVQRGSTKSAAVALFDDLHWADDSSVQLLLHLTPHLASMRLLIVGTYRDVDLDAKRPFAKALETLLRQRLATRISVKRLSASGVDQLLATMAGARPPESLVRAVYEETEGNPFFVEEVFEHLREEGRLFNEDGAWKTDLRVEDIDVPEGVRLVVSRRIERLGDEGRKVLTAAAVIGRSFPLDLLAPVAGISRGRAARRRRRSGPRAAAAGGARPHCSLLVRARADSQHAARGSLAAASAAAARARRRRDRRASRCLDRQPCLDAGAPSLPGRCGRRRKTRDRRHHTRDEDSACGGRVRRGAGVRGSAVVVRSRRHERDPRRDRGNADRRLVRARTDRAGARHVGAVSRALDAARR